jgi:hypothetical protein
MGKEELLQVIVEVELILIMLFLLWRREAGDEKRIRRYLEEELFMFPSQQLILQLLYSSSISFIKMNVFVLLMEMMFIVMELILLLPFMIVLSDVTCTPSSSSFICYLNSEGEFIGDFYSCGITEESGYSSLSHRHLTPMNVDGRTEEEGMNESNESVGRGGGIFISIHSFSFSSFLLHVLFEKLIFSMNEATIGRDLFIVYYSLEEQIDETVFVSSCISAPFFNKENAISGREEIVGIKGEDEELMEFIIQFNSLIALFLLIRISNYFSLLFFLISFLLMKIEALLRKERILKKE